MSIIKQNPFRVLGLTGNSSEKELQKQIGIIKAFARVGKTKTFDYDLEFMGHFSRTLEDIQLATSKIEQAHKKLHYALFWFVKNTPFDEIALNNLKDQNTEKAIEIWEKTLKLEISNKNFASYLNLSTLYIALSATNDQLYIQELQLGIDLKGKLIHSDGISHLSKLVTGNGLSIAPEEISKNFIEDIILFLKPYLNKKYGISTNELISLFDSYPKEIQKYISSKFTEAPISNIENQIERTIALRKKKPRDAEIFGEELYKNTKTDITSLKKLLGNNNLHFQMITNKLANEILQCSIDFFNKHREEDSEFDPGNDAIRIAKYSKSLGATGQTRDRINEAMVTIQEWVDDKPNRDRYKVISEDLAFVTNKLKRFQNLSNSIDNSRDLVVSCKPKLSNIKNELGIHDDFYLQLSSAIVGNALGMIIAVVNYEQDSFSKQSPYNRSIDSLKRTITDAVITTELIELLDMDQQAKQHFNQNKKALINIKDQIFNATATSGEKAGRLIGQAAVTTAIAGRAAAKAAGTFAKEVRDKNKKGGGCYIATMAYGDYDHPQVMILRKFRDDTLVNTIIGRRFISFYYTTSPHLVQLLKNQKFINKIIRNLLDKFVNKVK